MFWRRLVELLGNKGNENRYFNEVRSFFNDLVSLAEEIFEKSLKKPQKVKKLT